MTDTEIIKALECLFDYMDCGGCSYSPTYEFPLCQQHVAKDALDLITRQQAEIEQWKEEANKYQNLWCIAVDDIEKAKSEAVKEFAERLEEKSFQSFGNYGITRDVVEVCDIDNLIKEMEGDINA